MKIRSFYETLSAVFRSLIIWPPKPPDRALRVVFDTNIIVAAVTNPRSASGYLVNEALSGNKIRMCVSPALLEEYRIILKSFQFALNRQEGYESYLRVIESVSILVHPQVPIHKIQADKSDNKFLECAVKANAGYLVTSDKHFNFSSYKGIRIIRSKELEKAIRAD